MAGIQGQFYIYTCICTAQVHRVNCVLLSMGSCSTAVKSCKTTFPKLYYVTTQALAGLKLKSVGIKSKNVCAHAIHVHVENTVYEECTKVACIIYIFKFRVLPVWFSCCIASLKRLPNMYTNVHL